MKNRLIIIGAGGFGREIYGFLVDGIGPDWEIRGFLDDNPKALDGYQIPIPVLSAPQDYEPGRRDYFLPAIGNPQQKLKICRDLRARGGDFVTYVHPTATIGRDNVIEDGTVIYPGATLTSFVRLGAFVNIGLNATVGHDAVMGDGCILNGHAEINGGTRLGEGVFMGSHSSVLPNVRVGDYAVVGAGSVVISHVRPHTTVVGVPAVKLTGV